MSEQVTQSAPEAEIKPNNQEQLESEAPELEAEGEELDSEPSKEAEAKEKEEKSKAKRLKKLKLKVDGQELEEELPFEIDDNPEMVEYLKRNLQLAKMAQKRAHSYAELEKEVVDFIQELKTNPRKALSDPNVGIDVKELAKSIIEEELENMKKTPEQIEKERLEAELKAMKEEREKEKETLRQRELEMLEQKEFERYDALIDKALTDTKLPRTPYVVRKIADNFLVALDADIDPDPVSVANLVKDEMLKEMRELVGSMPEEMIEEFFGKEILGRLRKRRVQQAKNPAVLSPKKTQDVAATKESDADKGNKGKKMTFKEFFKI